MRAASPHCPPSWQRAGGAWQQTIASLIAALLLLLLLLLLQCDCTCKELVGLGLWEDW
jgi:hypothetical protein